MVHECHLCSRGVDHCHGTLVQHGDGTFECVEPECDDQHEDMHELVVECWQLTGGCGCTQTEVPAAS